MKNNNNKTEKKGGLFGLLNGGAANAGSITPGVIGGTAQAAASGSGLAALFSAKAIGTVLTVAFVGGIGAFGLMSGSDMGATNVPNSAAMMASAQEAENYVPAIERANAENAGKSSIGMFNETNKGAVKFDVDPTLNVKGSASAAESGSAEMGEYDTNTDATQFDDPEDMAAEAMEEAGVASFNPTGLSTSIGGSDRSSKTVDMTSAGKLKPTFMPAAKNFSKNVRTGKAVAFRGVSKAQKRSANRAGARNGKKAFQQAKFMNGMLKSAAASGNYATSRATMDAAWEGTASGGDATDTLDAGALTEGEGMAFGATGSSLGGHNNSNYNNDAGSYVPEVGDAVEDTPWSGTVKMIQTLMMIVVGLLALAAAFADWVITKGLAGIIIAGCILLCLAALALSVMLITKYQQKKLGLTWSAITGVSLIALCVAAFAGSGSLANSWAAVEANAVSLLSNHMWLVLIGCAGVGLAMSMAGSVQGEKSQKAEIQSANTAMVYQLPGNPSSASLLS